MGATAKVTSKGQITLPASFRLEHGIEPGDEVVFVRTLAGRVNVVVRHRRDLPLKPLFTWDGPTVPVEAMDPGLGEAPQATSAGKARDIA